MDPEMYLKIKNICNKLTLINNSNKKDNNSNIIQIKSHQINKKIKNVLFSGKDYLEDKQKNNITEFVRLIITKNSQKII